MSKRPTRSDVARLAGVSSATVSYVINNGPRPVSDETRQRVLSAIKELGYRPHAIARSLKTGSTRTIGLLVPSLLPALFGHLVTAVEDELAERNYGLILASSHENVKREREMLYVLADRSIDGLLYVPMSAKNGDLIKGFIEDGIPVVFVDRYTAGVPADVVMTDNIEAARRATNHLIQTGSRKIVCISFHDTASTSMDRVEGYRRAFQERGLPVEEHMILQAMWPFGDKVDKTLNAYLDTYGVPDAIFCTVEGFLGEVAKVLRERGIRIPDQVRIAGGFTASTSPWQELTEYSIPIVRQNYQMMARRAVAFIMERIQGVNIPPRLELVPAELYV